jgi:hypothetical protein
MVLAYFCLSFKLFFLLVMSSTCLNKLLYIKDDPDPIYTIKEECEREACLVIQPVCKEYGLFWQLKCSYL